MSESIFKKALVYLGLKDAKGEYPNKVMQVEVVNTQPNNCITNKLIYNVNTKKVIVITCDGDKYEGDNIEKEQIEALKTANVQEIVNILTPKHIEEVEDVKEEMKLVSKFLGVFDNSDDFDVVGEQLYFRGIRSTPIPHIIVARFIEILQQIEDNKTEINLFTYKSTAELNEEYNSLKMFTAKLLTSPRQESIDQVLTFCRHNNLCISKFGNIIAYRRVKEYSEVAMPKNEELLKFVKESIEKVKKWKKSPKNYWVYEDTMGRFFCEPKYIDSFCKGNLYELYNNQSLFQDTPVQLYSSQHSYGKYTFAIGDIYKSEEGDIDVDAGQCHSGGLHFASVNYDYSGYGSTPVVVLINPAKTITIPLNETAKGRTTEMKIACLNPNDRGVHIDYELIAKADEEYNEYTMEELQNVISQKTLVPLSVEEEVTNLSIPEVVNIKELLSKRVITI